MKTGRILSLVIATSLSTPAVQAETLFRGYLEQPVSQFDPLYMSSPESREVSPLIHQGLVNYSARILPPKAGAYSQVVPALAESWEIAPDKKTYIFKLRDSARFHNGRRVTAADVKYSFERACNPNLNSPGDWAVQRLNIKGLKRYQAAHRAGVREPHLAGIEVLDQHLVQIHLEKAIPMALDLLTLPYFSIVPSEDVERWWKDFRRFPVGAGPYQLASVNAENTLSLKRFGQYYDSQSARTEALELSVIPEAEDRFQAFVKGQLDHTPLPAPWQTRVLADPVWNPIGPEKILKAAAQNNLSESRVVKLPQWTTHYLSMNNQQFPFDQLKVRQAFNHAVDKKWITDTLLQGYARPVTGIFPTGFPGARSQEPLFRQDLERARVLLFEAGWRDRDGDGDLEPWQNPQLDLTLFYQNQDLSYALCRKVQENLAAIGVRIKLAPLTTGSSPAFYHAVWTPELLDASQLFYPTFHSGQSGQTNTAHYRQAQVDQLIQQAEDLTYEPKRYALYAEAERLITADAPWIFLYHPVSYQLVQPRISQYVSHPGLPFPYPLVGLDTQTVLAR
jgi:oligopeptide transport system substrate-binding protein